MVIQFEVRSPPVNRFALHREGLTAGRQIDFDPEEVPAGEASVVLAQLVHEQERARWRNLCDVLLPSACLVCLIEYHAGRHFVTII